MNSRIDDIVLRVKTGKLDFSHRDLRSLLEGIERASNSLAKIQTLSSKYDNNPSSMKCTLESINEVTKDFQW